MVGIDINTLFPNSKMSAAVQLGQSRFRNVDTAIGGGGGPVAGPEAAAFLARTSGLDATHTVAYTALINGLAADGVWSKLDMLHIYATQDSTTAKLNLVSSSYTGVLIGSPTFTVDRGYTGVAGANAINTGFNPSSAPSPKFIQNSAHLSVWSLTAAAFAGADIGHAPSGDPVNLLYTRFTDDFTYFRINTNAGPGFQRFACTDARGHFIANRFDSASLQGFRNGSLGALDNAWTSQSVLNSNIYTVGYNNNGIAAGTTHQLAMASIGMLLNATDVTNFYNRLRTYMTAVGVP